MLNNRILNQFRYFNTNTLFSSKLVVKYFLMSMLQSV